MTRAKIVQKGKEVANSTDEMEEEVEIVPYKGKEGLKGKEVTNFNKLDSPKRTILPTRFLHAKSLKKLGFYDLMQEVMDKIGLSKLLDDTFITNTITYPQWTLEFLATLSSKDGVIKFRLNKERFTLSHDKLREALGISKQEDGNYKPLSREECSSVWEALTHLTKFDNQAKNADITHPVLRLAHRFVAMAFFGQGEPTKVSKDGINILYAMTSNKGGVPDWAQIFIDSCLAKQNSPSGKISMGGMITLIADYLHVVDPPGLKCLTTEYFYNMHGMVYCNMMIKENKHRGFWTLGAKATRYLHIPRTPLMTPLPSGNRPKDWFVAPDDDLAMNERVSNPTLENEVEEWIDSMDTSTGDDDEAVPPFTRMLDEGEPSSMASRGDLEWYKKVEKRLDTQDHEIKKLSDVVHLNNTLLLAQHRLFRKLYPNDYTGPDDGKLADFSAHHGIYDWSKNGGAGSSHGGA